MPHSNWDRRRESGKALGSFLALLILLLGAGGWNYHRNLQAEKAEGQNRPYATYASEDLAALRSAYDAEAQGSRAHFDQAKRNRVRSPGDAGSVADNVAQFQKATRASSAIRDAASHVAASQSQIAELDREIELRARFGREGIERHIKRLTTL